MTKQFQKDLTSSELKTAMKEGRRLSSLSPKTKDWIRGRLLEDTSVKPKTKVEKAADNMTKTGGGLINWAKKNPVQAALLVVPGAVGFRLASKAGTFLTKKYGSKAADKVKDTFAKKMAPDFKVPKKESVISKTVKKTDKQTPPIQKSGVDKIVKKKIPPIQRSGVDKLKLAKQKVNNSKQIKNLNLSFDDKKKIIQEMSKGNNKTLATAFTQVLRKKNSKLVGKESVKEARKQAKSVINKPKVDKVKPVKVDKKPVKVDKKPIVSKDTGILLTRKLIRNFKNNDKDIIKKIMNSDMDRSNKNSLISALQDTINFQKRNPGSSLDFAIKEGAGLNPMKVLRKGGLIKKNIGGTVLKNIPAGNKGLRKLPTPVRNKMGFAKRGGVVKKNTGGFLGAGKALRGQGAVMRKRGGKIGY